MLAFHEVKGPLAANIEAVKILLEVGEAADETLNAVIVLLETTISTLREIRRKSQASVAAPGKSYHDRSAGRPVQEVAAPSASSLTKRALEQVAIKKTELMQMGVSLSTIREWQDQGKLKKTGRFGLYHYDQDVHNLVVDHLAEKKGRAKMETTPARSDSSKTISRKELIRRGVTKSTIGYWSKTGKLRRTGIPGEYVFDGSVRKLIENYKRQKKGAKISDKEAMRRGKISRQTLIGKGISESTIGFWVNSGKLQKTEEKGYYVFNESAQKLIDSYRPKR